MKMAAIKKIVMDAKRCIIVTDRDNKQWIGDGKRFYAVDEDIRFDRETVLTILDVEKDKRNKVNVFKENSTDPRFSIYPKEETGSIFKGERLKPHMAIMYGGELIMIFMTDRNEVFALEHAALKPVEGMGRDYMLLRRDVAGEEMRPAIAVSADMFVAALLQPLPAKVAGAVIAECGVIASGQSRGYGDDDDEELVRESEMTE